MAAAAAGGSREKLSELVQTDKEVLGAEEGGQAELREKEKENESLRAQMEQAVGAE